MNDNRNINIPCHTNKSILYGIRLYLWCTNRVVKALGKVVTEKGVVGIPGE